MGFPLEEGKGGGVSKSEADSPSRFQNAACAPISKPFVNH